MATRTKSNGTVIYDDTPEMHKRVFDHVMAWFHEHECYCGEDIIQMDKPQETAAPMLADLADDVIKFDVTWNEDS